MKIVNVCTTNGTRNITVRDDVKLVDFLRENNISIEGAALAANGWILAKADLGKTMGELTTEPQMRLGITRKTTNACTVTALGHNAVLKSSLKRDQVWDAMNYSPDSLVLKEDGEPVFAVDLCGCAYGVVNTVGVEFSTSDTADGYLTATIDIPCEVDAADVKKFLTENYGNIMINVDKIERQVAEKAESIAVQKAAIDAHITVM